MNWTGCTTRPVICFCFVLAAVVSLTGTTSCQESKSPSDICLPAKLVDNAHLCLGQNVDSIDVESYFKGKLQYSDYLNVYGGQLKSPYFVQMNMGLDSGAQTINKYVLVRNPILLEDMMGSSFSTVIGECRKAYGEDYRIVNSTQKTPETPIEPIFTWDKDDYAVAVFVSVVIDSARPDADPRLIPMWFSLERQPAGNRYPDRPDSEVWTRSGLGLPEK